MPELEKANILLVDDLPEKLLVYRSILEELGQNIIAVRSGEEALKQVLRSDFAVILLDVQMPGGMDGFETAQMIRKRRSSAHIPIIFLTAFTDEVKIAQGYATGAVDYLPTPVVPEILRAKVRVFVELHQMRQQLAQQAQEQARRAAAEESARRSAFLAEASRSLDNSLDFETTLRTLARLPVPQLADLCVVTLADDRGGIGRTECAWLDATENRARNAQCGVDEADLADWLVALITRAMAADRFELVEGLDPSAPLLNAGANRSLTAGPAAPAAHSAVLVLPLAARGRTLGAVTLALSTPGRGFRSGDVALAEELTGRAAIALDNALLVRDIQENDRRRNEFLAMLAHELRNPLAPIRSAAQILHLRAGESPDLDWVQGVLDRQVSHLVRLVDDLLDVSRITRGKIKLQQEPLDVAGVVAQAVETSRPVMELHGHEIAVHLPDESIRVLADPTRLAQVLSNLLNNAAKYTPNGGRVSLSIETSPAGEVVFRVRDTGLGIPREMLSKVFDLFTQVDNSLDRSQGGLGIGLTLVRRLVELHGGKVEAHSDGLGRGSEFVVRLPLLAADDAGLRLAPDEHTAPLALPAVLRVLVVDDNVDAADGLAQLLRHHGHEVAIAHNGPETLVAVRSFRPEVVILDIGLPGQDGYEVARCLRGDPATHDTVLIALSGYGHDDDRQRSRQAGFDHHLTKPIDYRTLDQLFIALRRQRPASHLTACG